MHALTLRARIVSDRVALAAGLDARLLAMLMILGAVWLGLDALTGGTFLTPRNLFNLSLQVAVVGIMSCGMVLVIVSRHIDPADRRFGDLVDHRSRDASCRVAYRPCPGSAHCLWRRSLLRHYSWRSAF